MCCAHNLYISYFFHPLIHQCNQSLQWYTIIHQVILDIGPGSDWSACYHPLLVVPLFHLAFPWSINTFHPVSFQHPQSTSIKVRVQFVKYEWGHLPFIEEEQVSYCWWNPRWTLHSTIPFYLLGLPLEYLWSCLWFSHFHSSLAQAIMYLHAKHQCYIHCNFWFV